MPRLLHVAASPRGAASFSRRIAASLIAALGEALPALSVTGRDLAAVPIPHPDAGFVAANLMPDAERGAAERQALVLSEALIAELEAADLLLSSAPMHNFTVPSALKAWIDLVVRPERSFARTPGGKRGLLRDRPGFAIVACGGRFGDGPAAQADFFSPYLRHVLATIGLTDLALLRLEEVSRGPEAAARARDAAEAWIAAQVARLAIRSGYRPAG